VDVDRRAYIYGDMADKLERDPYGPDGSGRAVVVNGRGFQLYKRFNPSAEYVTVTTLDGRIVELTRTQANVLDIARTYIDNGTVTMREIAAEIRVAPSTVYRALVKLASFGLIGYLTGKGRWNRTVIFSRGKNDGLDAFTKAAKATIRKWSEATYARFSRLRASVASYVLEDRDRGYDSLTTYFLSHSHKGATLNLPWTVEDISEIV